MKRSVVAVDRFVLLLLGVLLLAAGVLMALWSLGRLGTASRLDVAPVADLAEEWWWPSALGLIGLALILVAIRWLIAHVPRRRISTVALSTPRTDGPSTPAVVDMGALAGAFADDLAQRPGIASARGRAVYDGGDRVFEVVAKVDDSADLDRAIASSHAAMQALATASEGRTDGTARVRLRL